MRRRWFRVVAGGGAGALLSLGVAVDRAGACPKCRLGATALTGSQPGESPWSDEHGHDDAAHAGEGHDQVGNATDVAADLDRFVRADGSDPAAEHRGPLHPFQLTGGVNITTAYYHRGYLQEDQGVIAQPYLTLAYSAYESDPDGIGDLSVTPYVSWWNSLHDEHTFTDGDYDLWYESELMAGAVIASGPLSLDVKYTLYSYPNGALAQIEELGAKVSFDFSTLWWKGTEPPNFVLLGWVAVDKELSDRNEPPVASDGLSELSSGGLSSAASGAASSSAPRRILSPGSAARAPRVAQLNASHAPIFHQPTAPPGGSGAEEGFDTSTQGTYIELGLDPSFRLRAGDITFGLSFPVVLGLGAGDYYQETGGDNDPLGYLQAGVQATVPLPIPGEGKWFLSASVTYLHLFADSLQFANYGDKDEVIGTVGISFAY